jgi:hypothetical protein
VLRVCRKAEHRLNPFELMSKWNYMIVPWAGLCVWVFGKQDLTNQFLYIVVGWIPLSILINNGLHSIIKIRNKHNEYKLYRD